jgi:oligopeptide/dipeptide ABC transporter ATP-binding protein
MSGAPLLEVEGLSVTFPNEEAGRVTAVDDLSFGIERGETLVIVGESGSGKSVTSLAVMGLIQAPGSVRAKAIRLRRKDGVVRDLPRLPEAEMRLIRGAEIAMIFQEPMTSLNPVYTIGEQIIEAIRFHETMSRRAALARAEEMLKLLGIPEPRRRLDAFPHQLSGGMRQRAMIGMALSCRPSLLIADEPTTALDVTVQAQILELIRGLQRELGMAVIFITHNLGVAAEIADRIMVMYAGQAVETGPCRAIFRSTHLPYTIGLMRSVPRLGFDRDSGPLPAIPGNVPDLRLLPPGCRFHPRCSYFAPGLCDRQAPALEACGEGHLVRCLRWPEVAA